MIRLGDNTVSLDAIVTSEHYICLLSVYDGSLQRLKSFCAQANLGEEKLIFEGNTLDIYGQFQVFITSIINDKKKFYHALLVHRDIKDKILITTKARAGEDFFNYLMRKYNLPLLNWWGDHLLDKAIINGAIQPSKTRVKYGNYSFSKSWSIDGTASLDELEIFELIKYDQVELEKSIQELFDSGEIWISQMKQKPLAIDNMDDYFKLYGHALVKALEKHINPLTALDGNCKLLALRNKRLFPQQSAMVNGIISLLDINSYAIMAEGMGVGKSLQAASVVEGYFNQKFMRKHPGIGLADIYSGRENIRYRNIIMAPGHTLEKWVNEITQEIPYVKAHILEDFKQLLEIRDNGPERTHKEYWVVGKDFAKLSYMSRPTPSRVKIKRSVRIKKCSACDKTFFTPDRFCPFCGNDGYTLGDVIGAADGLVCPECGEILLEYKTLTAGSGIIALKPGDFANPTNSNSKCYFCGAVLWQPHAAPIDTVNLFPDEKHIPWYRATHYSNKIHNATKSVWVHKKYASEYFEMVGEEPLNERPDCFGVRKYSPAEFIKRYMCGYWDFAIFDEAHQCEFS